MTLIAWAGVTLMVFAIVLAIRARRRIWGRLTGPAVADTTRPNGTILLIPGAHQWIVPLLTDWQARGVLEVRKQGPELAKDARTGAASGPEWVFTVLDASGVDEIELPVLQTLVPRAPAAGATFTLTREDTATRDALAPSIYEATKRQREAFGVRPVASRLVAVALNLLAIIGGALALAGTIAANFPRTNVGSTRVALALFAATIGIATVALICKGARRQTDAERQYWQRAKNLELWVRTTETPNIALAGWAMYWGMLPGIWLERMPTFITQLRGRDGAFLRGDFNKRNNPV